MMTMNVDADGHWLIGFTLARVQTEARIYTVLCQFLKDQRKKINKCADTLH